jgi:nucleotide-binding universal stress UspA family protein
MIHRLLVPLDGSALAESILPSVEEFVRLTGAGVTVMQVVEPVGVAADLFGQNHPGVERDLQAADERLAHDYLAGLARRLARGGIVAHTRVAIGPVAETIIQAGREFDLIAMATHGRSGVGRWVYGSVADKVLRGATAPVLLFRAGVEVQPSAGRPRRILVPLDGSELAGHVVPLAIDLARRAGAEIILMQSISLATESLGMLAGGAPELLGLAEEGARDYLNEVAKGLRDQGLTVAIDVRLDPAADGILAVAAERSADLIVMSTHGRGGFGRWVYGSVADRVLRGAPIPVLLVRATIPLAAPPAMGAGVDAAM